MRLSPKQKKGNNKIMQSTWYNFYAGYSDIFVEKYICEYLTKETSVVLDPWNGSGTTTLVASYTGKKSVGIDINPVMKVVAMAKQYRITSDLIDKTTSILDNYQTNYINMKINFSENDYLTTWFTDSSVSIIRSFEKYITSNILGIANYHLLKDDENINCKTSFYYMILFNVIKNYCNPFFGSNPTWVKVTNITEKKILTSHDFIESYKKAFILCCQNYSNLKSQAVIKTADSKHLPLEDNSIDAIITSPPYCTRIDYVISTIIELAIMGYSSKDIDTLRRKAIGTPTVAKECNDVELTCSETCVTLLNRIRNHESKAASSYYYKTFRQYFEGMLQSIQEINRVLKPGGVAVLVVQNSYFKGILVNATKCLEEMFISMGFSKEKCLAFKASNNMRYINTKSRKYKSKTSVQEKVLILRKVV